MEIYEKQGKKSCKVCDMNVLDLRKSINGNIYKTQQKNRANTDDNELDAHFKSVKALFKKRNRI